MAVCVCLFFPVRGCSLLEHFPKGAPESDKTLYQAGTRIFFAENIFDDHRYTLPTPRRPYLSQCSIRNHRSGVRLGVMPVWSATPHGPGSHAFL